MFVHVVAVIAAIITDCGDRDDNHKGSPFDDNYQDPKMSSLR